MRTRRPTRACIRRTSRLEPLDLRITVWMARHGVTLTRTALGIVFPWFGAIKFVPGWSPAADLATRTNDALTFGVVPPAVVLPLLSSPMKPS